MKVGRRSLGARLTISLPYLWALVALFPMLFLVGLAFSNETRVDNFWLGFIPRDPTLGNFGDAFAFMERVGASLPRALANSVLATGVTVFVCLTLSSLVAWALATMEFRARKILVALFSMGLVVPTSVMIIPEFLLFHAVGIEGRPALYLAYIAFGISLPTLLLTVFFRGLATEILDAARMDGATGWREFVYVGLPLVRPALGAAGMFLFLVFWNEFPLALILVRDSGEATLPLALSSTQGRFGSPFNVIASVMLLASLPALLAFTLGQRQIVAGLTSGMLKR
jgi:ABC-type glycerol-3-phosphate transport system permease component